MAWLNDLYMLCAGGGFVYLVGTALMGFAHQGGGDAGDGGGDGGGDAGGDAGSIDAGGDAGGSADGGDFGSIDVGDIKHVGGTARATGLAHARTGTTRGKRVHIGLLLLKITSPYTVACFCFFFGLTGLIAAKYLPFPALVSLLPATIIGIIGYNAMTNIMNSVADKLYASSTHKEEDVIGTVAEVTIPITEGRTGEIIYLTGKTRNAAPAKCKNAETKITKTSKVMIADVQDGVFIVEPCNDLLLEGDGINV